MEVSAKVTKWGNSLGLRINQEIAAGMNLDAGSKVSLVLDEESHVLTVKPVIQRIKKWPFKENDLIKGLNHDNSHSELLATLLDSEVGK